MHDPSHVRSDTLRGAVRQPLGCFVAHDHSEYRTEMKLTDGVFCPECHASVRDGRWQWLEAEPAAVQARCPACRRIDDDFPAGFVSIEGEFFDRHRVELMNLVQTRANRAAAENPLSRLMGSSDTPEGVLLTTTDTDLAQEFGTALRDDYGGAVNFSYESDHELLRVHWAR